MANFKTVVRNQRKDGFWQVYVRVTHRRVHGYVKTDKMVTNKQLSRFGEVTDPYVQNFCNQLILDFNERLNRVDISAWSCRQVVEYLKMRVDDLCFSDYARIHIDRLIDNGQERTSKNYKLALQHMERFFGSTRIMFSQLTSAQVSRWIETLASTARAKEMYPVCMRQVFKAAVDEYNDYDNGIIRIKMNPWRKVKIPMGDVARKRAITAVACREFFTAELSRSKMSEPLSEFGRDVAMLSLCLAGMNTVDLYEAKKEDYRDGVVCYRRAKTRKLRTDDAYFEIAVEPEIMPLMEKYAAPADSRFLFNFHKRFSTSDSFCANANNGIRQVCKQMGLPKEQWYCVYTFRHTWATVARNDCGASIEEVAFALNHSHGHRVTRGYIKPDFHQAWRLNRKVLDFIFVNQGGSRHVGGVDEEAPQGKLFRLSPKMMVYARAYFRGEVLAEVSDIGFSNVDEVIERLARTFADTIPERCPVQFRIRNCDTDREVVYERTKGKGF